MEEEFDFNLDSDIGTSVAKLKNNTNSENKPDTETAIDYDEILNDLHLSDSNKQHDKKESIHIKQRKLEHPNGKNENIKQQPKKINMNQFARKVENNIDNNQFARKVENNIDNNKFDKDIFMRQRDNEMRIVRDNFADVKQNVDTININMFPKIIPKNNQETKE